MGVIVPFNRLYDMAKMSTATTGTGTITLGSAASGFQTFAAAGVQDGDQVTYSIQDAGGAFEIGRGVYTASGTTLTRATILDSSNSGAAISLSGNATVFIAASRLDLLKPPWFSPPTSSLLSTALGSNLSLINDPDLGLIAYQSVPQAGNYIYGALQSLSSGDFTLCAHVEVRGLNINYMGGGLGVYDSVSGRNLIWGAQQNLGNIALVLEEFATPDVYNSTPYSYAAVNNQPDWLAIQRVSSTLYFYYSFNGKVWYLAYSASQTAWMSDAPNYIGLMFSTNQTSTPIEAVCDYWNLTYVSGGLLATTSSSGVVSTAGS